MTFIAEADNFVVNIDVNDIINTTTQQNDKTNAMNILDKTVRLLMPFVLILFNACACQKAEETQEGGEMTFSLVPGNYEDGVLPVEVTPSGDALYYASIITKDRYKSDKILLDNLYYDFRKSASEEGVSLEEYLSRICLAGVQELEFVVDGSVRDYVIYAFGINPDGTPGEITRCDYSLPDPSLQPLTIDVAVENITANSALFSAKPSDKQADYYVDIVAKSEIDKFASEEDFLSNYIDAYRGFIPMLIKIGDISFEYADMMAETEYCFMAFGINANTLEPTTEMFRYDFATEAAGDYSDFKVDFEVEVHQVGAKIKIAPSDPSIFYYYGVMPAPGAGSVDAALKDLFESTLKQLKKDNPGFSDEDLIRTILMRDVIEYEVAMLEPETEYTVAAVACDFSGVFLSDVCSHNFTTPEYVVSDVYVKAHMERYFIGNELYEYDPSVLFYERIVSEYGIDEVGPGVDRWAVWVFPGDLRDEAEYQDWELVGMVQESYAVFNPSDNPITFFTNDDWTEVTYVTVACDASGNWGKVAREYVEFTEEGAASAEDWFGESSAAKRSPVIVQ